MYDINKISNRLKKLRIKRYKEYKEQKNDITSTSNKYECCSSQEKFAEKIGVERRTIISWEKGTSIPSVECLVKICNVLDCSVDYLLGSGDLPEIDPISKASHYSNISATIIRYALENNDYLDCLNFFMLPENCSELFNHATLFACKDYWIDVAMDDIKPLLKNKIITIFDEYNAITPFPEIKESSYKEFLERKLPQSVFTITREKNTEKMYIKDCFEPKIYLNLYENKNFNYQACINYISKTTFKPMIHRATIELQKAKLASAFVELFTKYLKSLK